ncbi:MAG: FtsW/RodA/SpoVE family cell cycle protein [Bacteroidales bacterium]
MNISSIIEFFKTQFKGDKVIWRILFLLSIISLIAVYGSISLIAINGNENNTTSYLIKQALTLSVGISIAFLVHKIDYILIYKLANLLVLCAVLFLALTFSSAFAVSANDASRWIQIPGIGIQFQPSEFAKIALIIYITKTLSIHQNNLHNPKKALYPILIITALISSMILISNFSTSFFIIMTVFILLIIGRVPAKHILILTGSGLVMVLVMGTIIFKNPELFNRGYTWQNRIVSFVPELAPYASGYDENKGQELIKKIDNYQVTQAKIAIAEGGIIGKAPGNSNQKYRLSQAYCDFIYAIIIEDYGLFGGIVIILLYLVILYRAAFIVRKCNYTFPALLVIGLTFSLVFQAFIHMGVAVNLLPATGQPLPIISHGASSLLTTSISFGIILGVSRKIESENSLKKQEQ